MSPSQLISSAFLGLLTVAVVWDAIVTTKWLKVGRKSLQEIMRSSHPGRRGTSPMYCGSCGAYLMGSLTAHKKDCEVRALIVEHFGEYLGPDA